MMRASILFFFTLGILARRGAWEARIIRLPLLWALLLFALLMSVQLYRAIMVGDGEAVLTQRTLDLAVRLAAVIAFWRMAWALAGSAARAMLLRIEPYVFLLFCAHLILIWLGGPFLGKLTGPLGSPLYPLYLILQPLLVLAVVIALGQILRRVAPRAAKLLSGGRL